MGYPTPMRQSQNGRGGHDNNAYVHSMISDDDYQSPVNNNSSPHIYNIPNKDSISHNPDRYDTTDNVDAGSTDKQDCCIPRPCRIFLIILSGLVLVGGVIVLILFFGKCALAIAIYCLSVV